MNLGLNDMGITIAAGDGNMAQVNQYLNNGANVNFQDHNGNTALHLAVQNNHFDIIKFLLERGASMTIQNQAGNTALDIAIQQGNNEIINYLRDYPTLMGIRMIDENGLSSAVDFETLQDMRDFSGRNGGKRRKTNKRRIKNKRRKTNKKRKIRKIRNY